MIHFKVVIPTGVILMWKFFYKHFVVNHQVYSAVIEAIIHFTLGINLYDKSFYTEYKS
jgi:hypothetical protein